MFVVACHSAPPPTTQPAFVVLKDVLLSGAANPAPNCPAVAVAVYSVLTQAPPPVTYQRVFQPTTPSRPRALESHCVLALICRVLAGTSAPVVPFSSAPER